MPIGCCLARALAMTLRIGNRTSGFYAAASLAALSWSAIAVAQPSITGVSEQSGTMVISGRQFGVHADHGGGQPFLNAAWNDFSGGIDGGNLALDGTNDAAWSLQ